MSSHVSLLLIRATSNANRLHKGHRTISSQVHLTDIRRALDYDGIPGVIGTGLGCAAHILLGYTPAYRNGINLRPEPRTQCPFPAPELYANQGAGPSRTFNRCRNRLSRVVTVSTKQGEHDLPEGVPQVRIRDSRTTFQALEPSARAIPDPFLPSLLGHFPSPNNMFHSRVPCLNI